jgi:phosphoribosylaminoimidazolecarboxamide formyltransferase/IMP cyclohydrolase
VSDLPVRRALLSVSDKTGLVAFAERLAGAGVEIVSSGGTAKVLTGAGVSVVPVAEVTGFAELLGGRVKTLHPAVHAGILADRDDPRHRDELAAAGIDTFDLVVANLYPFQETVDRDGAEEKEIVDQIDIGGPALIRAAAKNHAWVAVVTSPSRYDEVASAVARGGLSWGLRRRLAREAFFYTASYDAAIVRWLEADEAPPERMALALRRVATLRYGENPHQDAAAYQELGPEPWWVKARQLQGKELSFNNIVDAEAAWRHVSEYREPAVVIVKHTNPCGVAERASLPEAFEAAWECDARSAFGSVIAVNRPLDGTTAAAIAERFIEVVIGPDIASEAGEMLSRRRNLRVLEAPEGPRDTAELRSVGGGFLYQRADRVVPDEVWKPVGRREPSDAELADLKFAWVVATFAKSNAVVLARDRTAIGIGAGDQSRVGAADRALRQAGDRATGSVAASDAFLPFRDTIDLLAEAGVTAVVQPGGSIRDGEVIDAADGQGVALVFTGRRHFRH